MAFIPESARRGAVVSAEDMVPISPHDTNPAVYAMIYVGTAGTITMTTASGNVRGPIPVPQGYLNQAVLRVHATGTTATDIFGVVL